MRCIRTNTLSAMDLGMRAINPQDALQEHVIYLALQRCYYRRVSAALLGVAIAAKAIDITNDHEEQGRKRNYTEPTEK